MIFSGVVSRRSTFVFVLSAGVAGCAGLLTPAPSLPLTFGTPKLQETLKATGIDSAFRRYWGDYVARNWGARYKQEIFGQFPPQQDFYVRYHGRAWDVLTFQLTEVAAPDDKGRVKTVVKARMRNPDELSQERDVVLIDFWLHKEGGWMHFNTDPMLNNLRPIE